MFIRRHPRLAVLGLALGIALASGLVIALATNDSDKLSYVGTEQAQSLENQPLGKALMQYDYRPLLTSKHETQVQWGKCSSDLTVCVYRGGSLQQPLLRVQGSEIVQLQAKQPGGAWSYRFNVPSAWRPFASLPARQQQTVLNSMQEAVTSIGDPGNKTRWVVKTSMGDVQVTLSL